MTFKPALTLAALALVLPVAAHAETVTVVKTGEVVTTTYVMPSAPVSGTTPMTGITEPKKRFVTKDEVVEWRDSQPVVEQPRVRLNKPIEQSHRAFPRYND